jgi:phosphodiesterase/alkaline phosphatase D-like protein
MLRALNPAMTTLYRQVELPTGSNTISYLWCGAVTSRSATLAAQVANNTDFLRWKVSKTPDLSNPIYSSFGRASGIRGNTSFKFVKMPITGLEPATRYFYSVMNGTYSDGGETGTFRTFNEGAYSFQFGFASCTNTAVNPPLLDYITTGFNLEFFFHLGDLHYRNIVVDDIDQYRTGYSGFFTTSRPKQWAKSMPIYYMYDDHDYGPNDADGTSPGRQAAIASFIEACPHPPLRGSPTGVSGLYYTFEVGRCYFIVTDLRSMRSPDANTDDASKTMMGSTQKQWFKDEMMFAKSRYPVIFWVSTINWNDTSTDSWFVFNTEKTELANFFRDSGISGVIMLQGDNHCIAADDGKNCAVGTFSGFFSCCAAPIDQSPSSRGTWTQGTAINNSQFGLVTVRDGGGTVWIDFEGVVDNGQRNVKLTMSSLDSPKRPQVHRIQLGKTKIT